MNTKTAGKFVVRFILNLPPEGLPNRPRYHVIQHFPLPFSVFVQADLSCVCRKEEG